MNCWEIKNCGRNQTGDCPAVPNSGTNCWRVAGTMCGGKVQGTYAQKLANCMECEVYKLNKNIS